MDLLVGMTPGALQREPVGHLLFLLSLVLPKSAAVLLAARPFRTVPLRVLADRHLKSRSLARLTVAGLPSEIGEVTALSLAIHILVQVLRQLQEAVVPRLELPSLDPQLGHACRLKLSLQLNSLDSGVGYGGGQY